MTTVLRLTDVSVRRGERSLLSGLSGELQAGQVAVVLGPNGVGKSSLLLALAGLIPAEGQIMLVDRELSELTKREMTEVVAWQGELPPTEFGLTVRQRLHLSCETDAEALGTVAHQLDISGLLDRPLGQLSSGERQRTELAALALRDTPLWLLDEPTAHLDLKHQIRCIDMLKSQRDKGRTIVVVLHDIQQAVAVADYLILIDGQGGTVFGKAAELLKSDRLSALFDAPLKHYGELLAPDYGVAYESKG